MAKKFTLHHLLVCAVLLSVKGYGLTLDEAITTTLNNSTDLKKMKMGIELSAHDLKQKKASNYGRVDLMASMTHYNLPRTLTPLTPASMASGAAQIPTTQDMLSGAVAYNVELFNGMATTRSIEIASLQKEIMKNKQKLTKEQLIYNVQTLYNNILAVESKAKAQEAYIETLRDLHEKVLLRVQLGSAAELDALKSKADLSSAEATLAQLHSNIAILKDTLATVMMVPSVDNLQPYDVKVQSLSDDTQKYNKLITQTTKAKLADLDVKKSKKGYEKASSVYYPKVSFNAMYGLNAGYNDDSNPRPDIFNSEDVWQAGVDVKWNIFDFGAKASGVQKSKIALIQSQLQSQKTKRELQHSLYEALSKIDTAVAQYKSAQDTLSLVTQTRKIEQIRYESGASEINDLLYAQARYLMAQSALIDAKYNYQNAKNYLDYILEKGQK